MCPAFLRTGWRSGSSLKNEKETVKLLEIFLSYVRFPPSTMKANGAGAGASGDREWQCDELAASWEAAEELLRVSVKSYIPRGSS